MVINSAGGAFRVHGDYLYRTFQSFQFDSGIWGLFRVGTQNTADDPMCLGCDPGIYKEP